MAPIDELALTRTAHAPDAVGIFIVAAVRFYREGMASCLHKRDGLAVVGTAAGCAETLAQVAAARPDVVLLDTSVDDAVDLLRTLHATAPQIKTVLFAVENNEREIIACAEAGVAGYLPSDTSLDEVAATLVRVARGELFCPPAVAAALMRHVGAGAPPPRGRMELLALTGREREVLALIDTGLSNKEIALHLHIETATVKNHVHNLLDKLKVASRGAAVAMLGARSSPSLRRSARR